jgi:hypothetical protein
MGDYKNSNVWNIKNGKQPKIFGFQKKSNEKLLYNPKFSIARQKFNKINQ